ncbi:hypothetical protein ASF88_16000 [Leifsonia sp. Leaf336]|uniref:hypothetical protein n=1 Tax=Leifsonia sp. Leaf336 TaxID=1736341 RepID=UPI0006F8DD99|nr:hypothetical protein [Leifsonia sp. Leaf336]KQR50739.1 hypothetical protein ASF88_16000 [Leifsonia sp. Leaf336]
MTKYVLLYQGGTAPQSPEEGEQLTKAWMEWFGTAGDAILDPGNAFGASTAAGADLPASGATGYSVVQAASTAAVEGLLVGHPHLTDGGRIEIHETVDM